MSNLSKAIWEHLITKPKYNRLENYYQAEIKVREERTRERDDQIEINKIMKKEFNEALDKLIKEKIELKEEIVTLKKKLYKRSKKVEK